MNYKPRTKITEIPVANERLYEETGRLTKTDKAVVREMIEHIGEFIHDVIKDGQMQAVMIPYFGKFKPKIPKIKARNERAKHIAAGTTEIIKALAGKPPGKNPKFNNHETVRTGRRKKGEPEQGLDTPGTGAEGAADQG